MEDILKISDLQQLYQEADNCDQAIFAEMKSNILLVSGHHYAGSRINTDFLRRLSSSSEQLSQIRVRLTKNHIQRIQDIKLNNIASHIPDVAIGPANENELSDMKAAQMHESVWRMYDRIHKIQRKKIKNL